MQLDQIVLFAQQHWILVLLLILVIIAIITFEKTVGQKEGKQVTPHEVVSLINNEDAIVLDLRERDTYRKGFIVNAQNISFDALAAQLEKAGDKPVILVCAEGQQTTKAAQFLREKNAEKARILAGGMRAWREASLPVDKK